MNSLDRQKIDQKAGRRINRQIILNLLRREGPASRSEIAGVTGLSAAAVGFVVGDLIEQGFLVESEPKAARPGRRPIPVDLNRDGPLAIGLKFSTNRVDLVVSDLGLSPIDTLTCQVRSQSPEDFVTASKHGVESLLTNPAVTGRPVLGVGITMPARLDVESGDCVNSHRFGWRNVPISQMMQDALGYPVAIEDDTLAYGLAHQLFGLARSETNFLALAVGEGIGCAPIIDGEVRRGQIGNAGKIGHTRISDKGPLCECGRIGCLQASYSAASLERRWAASGHHNSLTHALGANEVEAVRMVSDAGTVIGRYLASWALLLDPKLVILGGEGAAFGDPFVSALQAALADGHYRRVVPVIVVDETRFYWTAGAAAVSLRHVFNAGYEPVR